jgi:hypothetical protein
MKTERELLHEILRQQRNIIYALRNMNYGTSKSVADTMQYAMNQIEKTLHEEGTHR